MRKSPAYRFTVLGEVRSPWRDTLDEAHADAVDADFATVEGDRLFVHVFTHLQRTRRDVVTVPRRSWKNGPTSAAGLSRIDRIIARREGRFSANF